MSHKENGDDSLQPKDLPSTGIGPKVDSVSVKKQQSFFREQPLPVIEEDPLILRHRTRRDVLLFGIGAVAALAGGGLLLPQATASRMGVRRAMNSPRKEWL